MLHVVHILSHPIKPCTRPFKCWCLLPTGSEADLPRSSAHEPRKPWSWHISAGMQGQQRDWSGDHPRDKRTTWYDVDHVIMFSRTSESIWVSAYALCHQTDWSCVTCLSARRRISPCTTWLWDTTSRTSAPCPRLSHISSFTTSPLVSAEGWVVRLIVHRREFYNWIRSIFLVRYYNLI